ncbi:unnamed protein product [Tuber melanosporum]|uniref:(Perigord truffle) hypothetical protein n=1 Tax=Tuber melanosporum (strain Mel28) TaxID=656061 RepID=D5G8G7_TUBMM|nr:uncharacterized protein GSTUM_00002857001 [Tuber melanosporum]CAZ80810.1 unnamed protein product [Tuber melanosporum]
MFSGIGMGWVGRNPVSHTRTAVFERIFSRGSGGEELRHGARVGGCRTAVFCVASWDGYRMGRTCVCL